MLRSRTLLASLALTTAAAGAVALASPALAGDRTVLQAKLTGAQEVPGPGDPDGKGTGVVKVREGSGEICVTITAQNVGDLAAGHIHEKAVGKETGPVVVTLTQTGPTKFQGCAVNAEVAAGLVDEPEEYYLNVHNPEFPAGALRADLGA